VLRRLQVDQGRWQPQSNPVLRPYSSGQKGNPDKVLEGIRGEGCTVMRASPDHKRGGFAGSLKRHARDRIDLFLKRAGPSLMVAEQAIALEGVDEPDALNTGSHRTIDPDDCGWSVLAGESRRGRRKQPGQGDVRLKAALSAISFCFDTIEIITRDMK